MEEEIKKAESNKSIVVPTSNEIGQPRIVTSSYYVLERKKKDLEMPKRLETFDCMFEDDAVFTSIFYTNVFVSNALYNGEFVPPKNPKNPIASQAAADFLNYCIRNMSYGTWWEAINNMSTDIQYGYSLLNMVVEKKGYGEYAGAYTLKKLAPRDQKSVYAWLWDNDFRDLVGVVQKPPLKQRQGLTTSFVGSLPASLVSGRYYDTKYPVIRDKQLLHFKYNTTNNNPQGRPPLINCYKAYVEKNLIEKYEVIGVSKDLGGALVLKVPSDLVERANSDPNSKEAEEYKNLQADAAKLHAGESSYIVLTSDVDDVSKVPLYDIQFKGIDGGGKQYNTSDIIDQKRKSIYNVFGAGAILLGQDGHGSYALSDDKTSTHAYYVERNLIEKCDVLNTKLAPRMLAVNNVYLNYKDMPVFRFADPQELNLDVMSKYIQRTGMVGKLTPAMLKHLSTKAKLPLDGIDDLDFTSPIQAKMGDGTAGNGSTQAGGAASAVNSENASKALNLIKDGDVFIDSETGRPVNILDIED